MVTTDGFESITKMLLEQKCVMEQLEAENRELRRQLTDLRSGVGIAVVIEGRSISLAPESARASSFSSQASMRSQEQTAQRQTDTHPIVTAPIGGDRWTQKDGGAAISDSFVL